MDGTIGSQIYALRIARKLTQKNLALLSGISQQHLSHLEQGKGDIELTTLRKLLDALGHELSFVPRPAAAALAARTRQWERFAQWEATQRRTPAPGSLVRAGALADFFLSRHKTRQTQSELRAHAEGMRAWRKLLSRVRLAADERTG